MTLWVLIERTFTSGFAPVFRGLFYIDREACAQASHLAVCWAETQDSELNDRRLRLLDGAHGTKVQVATQKGWRAHASWLVEEAEPQGTAIGRLAALA